VFINAADKPNSGIPGRGARWEREEENVALWQIALIVFVIAWAMQAVGVWMQTRHYQKAFSELRGRWSDGALGAGASASRFGKGVIALLVVSPSGEVRAARAMIGRTVFARFVEQPELEGLTLEELRARIESGRFEGSTAKRLAFAKAIEQIDKVGKERGGNPKRDGSSDPLEGEIRAGDAMAITGGALC
jgi:glucitol operon activator protein